MNSRPHHRQIDISALRSQKQKVFGVDNPLDWGETLIDFLEELFREEQSGLSKLLKPVSIAVPLRNRS